MTLLNTSDLVLLGLRQAADSIVMAALPKMRGLLFVEASTAKAIMSSARNYADFMQGLQRLARAATQYEDCIISTADKRSMQAAAAAVDAIQHLTHGVSQCDSSWSMSVIDALERLGIKDAPTPAIQWPVEHKTDAQLEQEAEDAEEEPAGWQRDGNGTTPLTNYEFGEEK